MFYLSANLIIYYFHHLHAFAKLHVTVPDTKHIAL
jgi:hypothetical protein